MGVTVAGVWFLAVTVGIFYFAWNFRKRQNVSGPEAPIGGPISIPKALWLGYTIGSWFFLPWPMIFSADTSAALKLALGVHLASWWIRGPLELVMIYKWFNWTPIYGITHDLVHIAVIGWLTWRAGPVLEIGSMDSLASLYLVGIVFFVTAEALFAFLFLNERGRKDSLIYFADETPRYRRINRITVVVVIMAFAHLAWLTVTALAYGNAGS